MSVDMIWGTSLFQFILRGGVDLDQGVGLEIVHRVSSSPLGPVDPPFRSLSGRFKFIIRCHKLNEGSLLEQETGEAIAAAEAAFTTWKKTTAKERADALRSYTNRTLN